MTELAVKILNLSVLDEATGCRIWQRSRDTRGYGHLRVNGRLQRAHRALWIALHGDIPRDAVVCHKCDVRACVEPSHLFVGTQLDNIADRHAKGRSRGPDGMAAPTAKLTPEQVRTIRSAPGLQREIAEQYGITQCVVSAIKRRKIWRTVSDERLESAA